MLHSFQENMSLALKHEIRVREKVGRSSVLPSSLMVDTQHGADLLILTDNAGSGCAARVRRFDKYPKWDFTIRKSCFSGGKTEYEKFRSGMCRWYFYGMLNADESEFQHWMLIDLDAWRRAHDKRDREGGFPLHYDEFIAPGGNRFLVYSATQKRLVAQPGFMVDCHDYSYPGPVRARHFFRQQEDVKRFSRRAA